jgi:putative sigma-54 modulation protein
MKITLQTTDFKASGKLQKFVTESVAKLSNLNDRIEEGFVLLRLENSSTKDNKTCELKLVVPGNDLFATRGSETFEEAIIKSITAVRHQLQRRKQLSDKGKRRGKTKSLEGEEIG